MDTRRRSLYKMRQRSLQELMPRAVTTMPIKVRRPPKTYEFAEGAATASIRSKGRESGAPVTSGPTRDRGHTLSIEFVPEAARRN